MILILLYLVATLFMKLLEDKKSLGSVVRDGTAIQIASDGAKYIKAIHADMSTLKAVIGQRDSVIESLINKHTSEIVKLRQEVRILKASRTDSVIYVLTQSGDTMPQYTSSYKDQHLDYTITANADTCKLDLMVISEPIITTEWKRSGIFGPKEPYVYVRDSNPYIVTTGILPTVVKGKKKNTGLKVLGALAFGAVLGVAAR